MSTRRPLVNVSGTIREMPSGDTLPSDTVSSANGVPVLVPADTVHTVAENYSYYSIIPMRVDGVLRIDGVLMVAGG